MGKRGPPSSGTRNKTTTKPSPKNYRATTRWAVDYDYIEKLSPAEQVKLAQFSDEYYGCDFRYPAPLHNTQELRRERYRAQNRNYKDAVTRAGASMSLFPLDEVDRGPDVVTDLRPTPGYQGGAEYANTLAEYRRLIDIPSKVRTELQERRAMLLRDWMQSMAEAESIGDDNE